MEVNDQFIALIQQNKRILFKICNSYCRDRSDREDLAQEIVYQLWRSFATYNANFKFSTWMYRVALNVAISFYRKDRRQKNVHVLSETLIEIENEQEDDLEENIQRLQGFILELKELDRALILLYLEDKSYGEISEILGITVTNVATKLSRIKELLKLKFKSL
ncbi:MAG: RNA polymerase sigma factor [Bacteroidetes bacterium]|jgi:RNA polymerase sigma-70 factor (ECF subfamily)|nr:RNA polymerase sigma factor [Bacteroidota bacterium]MBP6403921.1 RNA polymerase sigma factor [Bacteroidia bacterium]